MTTVLEYSRVADGKVLSVHVAVEMRPEMALKVSNKAPRLVFLVGVIILVGLTTIVVVYGDEVTPGVNVEARPVLTSLAVGVPATFAVMAMIVAGVIVYRLRRKKRT